MANQLPGMIVGIEVPIVISFQWNPQIVNTQKKPHWQKLYPAGAEGPVFHYGTGDADVTSFTMDLSSSKGSVHSNMETFKLLTKPIVRGWGVKRPPLCTLILGVEFRRVGFITGINGAYGPIFHPQTMIPEQGKLTVAFEEVKLWNI